MPKEKTVTKGDLFSYAERCGCPYVGIAHTKDTMFRFKKEAIAIRFRRECDKREIPHPPRCRLHETRPDIKSKYDEKTWYKAYEHCVEHNWTFEDVAEDLGVSTKTVYRHFKKIGGEKIEN